MWKHVGVSLCCPAGSVKRIMHRIERSLIGDVIVVEEGYKFISGETSLEQIQLGGILHCLEHAVWLQVLIRSSTDEVVGPGTTTTGECYSFRNCSRRVVDIDYMVLHTQLFLPMWNSSEGD